MHGIKRPRIAQAPAFVLHRYPYRETSLIVDIFSRDYGRLGLLAKGAKRPHSTLRGLLQPFQPLLISWIGRLELRLLTGAEWVGGLLPLTGETLLAGFYVNELVMKFCAREEHYGRLFDHYVLTLTRLTQEESPERALRSFEHMLLRETGYTGAFDCTFDTRAPVQARDVYIFEPERGIRAARGGDPTHHPRIAGQTLLDMEVDEYGREQTLAQSKALMRALLDHILGDGTLNTRRVLGDLHRL